MATYIGNVPVPQATQTRDRFVATSGQTTFTTSGYTPNYLDVYLNGVKLDTTDYTATDSNNVVLTTGATVGDVIDVIAFSTFEPAGLATVATTGNYSDLNNIPELSSNALTEAFPIAAGGSVTAGKAVSLNTSGEVGEYPVVNELGTTYSVTTDQFNGLSTDGSRGIAVSTSALSTSSYSMLIEGFALSNSAAPTAGTTLTTTTTASSDWVNGNSPNTYVYPLTATKFLLAQFFGGYGYNSAYVYYNSGVNADIRLIEVDASGNVTQLASNAYDYTGSVSGGISAFYGYDFKRLANLSANEFTFVSYERRYNSEYVYTSWTINTSTDSITSSTDAEAANWLFNNRGGAFVNSNTVATIPNGNTYYTASWASNNLGAQSSASISLPSYASGGKWWVFNNSFAVGHYVDGNGDPRIATASINTTSGAITAVDTATWYTSTEPEHIVWDGTNGFIALTGDTVKTFEIISNSITKASDGSVHTGITPVLPSLSSDSYIVFNSSSDVRAVYNDGASNTKFIPITVNALTADAFYLYGISNDTASSGTASVVVGGVVSGLSGLTPTSNYYIDAATYDGSITTDSSGTYVGKAISSTKLLLGFN